MVKALLAANTLLGLLRSMTLIFAPFKIFWSGTVQLKVVPAKLPAPAISVYNPPLLTEYCSFTLAMLPCLVHWIVLGLLISQTSPPKGESLLALLNSNFPRISKAAAETSAGVKVPTAGSEILTFTLVPILFGMGFQV